MPRLIATCAAWRWTLGASLVLGLAACGGGGGGGGGGNGDGGGTVDGAPTASDAQFLTDRNQAVDGQLVASDPENDPLTFSLVTNPALGAVTLTAATGAFTYTPNTDAVGLDSFTFRVSDGDSNSNVATVTISISPAFTLDIQGGRGGANGGSGGRGGGFGLFNQGGAGELAIIRSGPVETAFDPLQPAPALGSQPLTVDADATVFSVAAGGADPSPAGTLYMREGSGFSQIFVSDANGTAFDETPVTGIDILPGATLSFELNLADHASVSLLNDLRNRGVITVASLSSTDRGGLDLRISSYIGDGSILTAGAEPGQNAGAIRIRADFAIYNAGALNAGGADAGASAGAGGGGRAIELTSSFSMQNTGALTTSGGDSVDAAGGAAGNITLVTGLGSLFNAGDLTARGGDGLSGGVGARVLLGIESAGDVVNRGSLDVSGGIGRGGNGADAGSVEIDVSGGSVRSSGTMLLRGGDSQGTAFSAGSGGDIAMRTIRGRFTGGPDRRDITPAGDLLLSGDIHAAGGDAVATGSGSGGVGGSIELFIDGIELAANPNLALLGYSRVLANGGIGGNGGGGGTLLAENRGSENFSGGAFVASGGVTNEADLLFTGGDVADTASQGAGGIGGEVSLTGDFSTVLNPDGETLSNSGAIDVSGGESLNVSGLFVRGSRVLLWAHNGVTNTGPIDANGGSDRLADGTAAGQGFAGGSIRLLSETGPVSNTAPLRATGGSGQFSAGFGGAVALVGSEIDNSEDMDVSGGDADPAITGSSGGGGGSIELRVRDGARGVNQSGALIANGGAGDDPGRQGTILEGGLCLEPTLQCELFIR